MRTLGKNSSHSLSHTESNLLSLRTALLAVHTKRVSTTPKGNPAQNAPIGLAATGGPRTEFNRRPEQADVRSSLSTGRNFSGNKRLTGSYGLFPIYGGSVLHCADPGSAA